MKFRLIKRAEVSHTSEDALADATTASLDADATPPAGPELLSDGVLLSGWFIRYELEKEMRRARRHGRHLSILALTPVPSLGDDRPGTRALEAAALAAMDSARATDLVGWLPVDRILIILPETDKDGAAAATHRWRMEMNTRTSRLGGMRWVVTMSVDPNEHENAEELLNSLEAAVV